ncbi:hypothetical protein V2J83_26860 [Pseudomonas alliivorans]|nr:hypothetical protein [Pseudomonas alliivorans]
MSRTGARDKARRQLTETLALLNESVALLGKSRSLIEYIDTPSAAQHLADLDAFCSCPFPAQINQHPDNQAVDTFAAAMKTKLAEARAKGRHDWSESWVQDKQLAELMVGHIPKGNAGNFEDIANFAMMLHQRGADPMELTLAFNKAKLGPTDAGCGAQNEAYAATIKERPILFSAPMVRAILEGRKTVTRRACKHQPDVPVTDAIPRRDFPHGPATMDWYWRPKFGHYQSGPSSGWDFKCPYGQPGDRLWVRETWSADSQLDEVAPREMSQGEPILYLADGASKQTGCSMITPGKSRPSIHMPRWVSRILLEITDVRVERLQAISEQQTLAEGIIPHVRGGWHWHLHDPSNVDDWHQFGFKSPVFAFQDLWISTGGDWDANPWVWVVEFKQVKP